ncbi:MAG: RDD family protein [Bacilli bacterium]|nr:RDD family protein [Bacilli bacterium]
MRYRRITAAIYDILIFMFIFIIISSFVPISKNAAELSNQLNNYTNNFLNLSQAEQNEMIETAYLLDRETSYVYMIWSLLIIGYFVFIPKWLDGKTLGQYFRKVKLVSETDEKVTLNQYIIRALLNSGLFLTILAPLFIYICDAIWYSNVTSILCLIQFIYWIVSFVVLIIKKKTIHDYVTNTKIIEVKR